MSLLVWLPLLGNLENQGASAVTVTNNGATVNTTGKIGSCYSFDGVDDFLTLNNFNPNGWPEISVTAWVYPTANSEAFFLIRGGGQHRFRINKNEFAFRDTNHTGTQVSESISPTFTLNTWIHIACVYKRGEIWIYQNGIQTAHNTSYYNASSTLLNDMVEFRIGRQQSSTADNYYTGKINDFRIYNHALSAAEVHEISQGLVLHYKLDDTYMETPTFLTSTINTTAYNSQNGKYGYNADSNLARTEGFFQGKNCIKISTITAGQNAQPYSYFSNLYTSNGTNSPAYKALSFDYFTTCPTTTWLNIYKLGSGTGTATWKTISATAGIRTGTYTNSSNSILVQPNEWNRVEVVFNGTTDADAQWGYCINGPKHTSSADYYFLFANIQLEQNDHVTGQGEGLHKAIITDSSGYGHNGTITGNITLNSNTPRYSISSSFNGTERITATTPGVDIRTLSCWCKTTKNKSTSQQMVADSFSNMTISFYNGTIIGVFGTTRGTGSKCTLGDSYKENDWNHIVVVKTDDAGARDIYCNGVKLTPTSNDYWGAATGFFVGARNTSNGNPFYGQISDVRAYCTALSAADVQQLYEVGAKVDNKQNLHIYEAIEMQPTIKLTKQGQMGAGEFQEDTTTKLYKTDQIIETNNLIEL